MCEKKLQSKKKKEKKNGYQSHWFKILKNILIINKSICLNKKLISLLVLLLLQSLSVINRYTIKTSVISTYRNKKKSHRGNPLTKQDKNWIRFCSKLEL